MQPALSSQSADLASLESALGYTFARPELLAQALAHRSQTHELAMETTGQPDEGKRADNERLEFLGDAVVQLVVTEELFKRYPDWQEGELTRMRSLLVNRQYLAKVAMEIGLGEHLRLSPERDRSGGRRNAYILANAMEAVMAAIFLDAGSGKRRDALNSLGGQDSLGPIRRFALKHILGSADDLAEQLRSGSALGDFKSALQRHLQAMRDGMPVYRLQSESGPDHRKQFKVEVRIRSLEGQIGEVVATGNGKSRKKAEQEAARHALAQLAGEAAAGELTKV